MGKTPTVRPLCPFTRKNSRPLPFFSLPRSPSRRGLTFSSKHTPSFSSFAKPSSLTVTPSNMIEVFLREFPPSSANVAKSEAREKHFFDWNRLFLVRVGGHEVEQHHDNDEIPLDGISPEKTAVTAAFSAATYESSRNSPHNPFQKISRSSFDGRTPATYDNNFSFYSPLMPQSRRWRHLLQTFRPDAAPTSRVLRWTTSPVYHFYYIHKAEKSARALGRFYAIPGLPQPPANWAYTTPISTPAHTHSSASGGPFSPAGAPAVTSLLVPPPKLNKRHVGLTPAELKTWATLISLQDYCDWISASVGPDQTEEQGKQSRKFNSEERSFFSAPQAYPRARTRRGTLGWGVVRNWWCVPLSEYLKTSCVSGVPSQGKGDVTGEKKTAPEEDTPIPNEAINATKKELTKREQATQPEEDKIAIEKVRASSKALAERAVGVLLLLAEEAFFFELLFHVHDSRRSGAYHGRQLLASQQFCFLQAPLWCCRDEEPEAGGFGRVIHQMKLPFEEHDEEEEEEAQAQEEGKNKTKRIGMYEREVQETRSSSVEGPVGGMARTILVYEAWNAYARATGAGSRKPNPYMDSFTHCVSEERSIDFNLHRRLLRDYLHAVESRKALGSGPNCSESPAVAFSPFPPTRYLLKKRIWCRKPLVLAEEMRYGLLITYKDSSVYRPQS